MRRGLLAAAVAMALLLSAFPISAADARSTRELLDLYLAGRFDEAVHRLEQRTSFDDVLSGLESIADDWIAEAPEAERTRRELTAATVALEAARIGMNQSWKLTRFIPVNDDYEVEITFWEAPPRLLEWGCALLRRHKTPLPVEHLWQLASNAVATRSGDFEFQIGLVDPDAHKNHDVLFEAVPIEHAHHLQARFPQDVRFKLAIGIAEENHHPARAEPVFLQLISDQDVGGEAAMRLGAILLNRRAYAEALDRLNSVELKTRDPWVLHHARLLAGIAHQRQNRLAEAERLFRRALVARPNAQTASIALATLLFRDGRRQEAAAITQAMLDANVNDPWRDYRDADDRFWPELIERIRREIQP